MRLELSRAFGASIAASFAVLALGAAPVAAQQRDTTAARRPAAADSAHADSASARRPARARRTTPVVGLPDSLARPPISPGRAFLYSFIIPGQGQKALHRPRATALFASIEVGSIFMLLKSNNDLRIAKAHVADSAITGYTPSTTPNPADSVPVYTQDPLSYRVKSRRLHVQDWVATLLFNHLFAGADAFVAAQLWDLPAQVGFRPAPGGVAVNASIKW